MRPIKLKLHNSISDAFLYMGNLFLLTIDRQLKVINNNVFFENYLSTQNQSDNALLWNIFFTNDELNTWQKFNNDQTFAQNFNDFWNRYTKNDFQIEIKEQHLTYICDLPDQEALDFIIYAQRAYLANRDGMHECRLNFDGTQVQSLGRFERVFDSKSTSINPRAGHILVSTKSDGLFSAALKGFHEPLKMIDEAIEEASVRTGWVGYNFVNYRNHTEANFILNDTEVERSSDPSWFKVDDIGLKDKKITKVGREKDDISKNIAAASRNSEVVFSFNSLSKSFAVTQDGNVFFSTFDEETNHEHEHMSIYKSLGRVKFDIETLGRPLSAHTVPNGTIYEFFEKVILHKNGKMQILSDFECSQVRTFASSKWYKNIAMALGENHLDVHCIHPYI